MSDTCPTGLGYRFHRFPCQGGRMERIDNPAALADPETETDRSEEMS